MKEHLEVWYSTWVKEHETTDLIYARTREDGPPCLPQVLFVRDILGPLVWSDRIGDARPIVDHPDLPSYVRVSGHVIGEHRSKSVRLPVYLLDRSDLGIQFVLRYNYYDWNVSVVSERPVEVDLGNLANGYDPRDEDRFASGYKPGYAWGGCFFQGFPMEYQFGPKSLDSRKFSICVHTDYELYTLVWLVMREVLAR